MTSPTTTPDSSQPASAMAADLFDNWFDPIEAEIRARARGFIEELIRGELDATLARPRYGRGRGTGDEEGTGISGYRHGQRTRSLTGTFGPIRIEVPRARLNGPDGKTTEWKSSALRAYQRRTLAADALIASTYLAGTNTRRVRRALAALFGGAVGKDTVSRTWHKVKSDWDAWNARPLADEPIVRLILDGTVVRVRLDRKATAISLLVVIGVRADGQKILLAIKAMGSESAEAWRAVLDDLIRRGLRRPEFLIVDGAPGLDSAIFHGYYDCYCYLPLYVFCGRHLLAAKLRPADIDASAGSVAEVERIVRQIRARWPLVRIVLRADSGFAREVLMAWCEENRVD